MFYVILETQGMLRYHRVTLRRFLTEHRTKRLISASELRIEVCTVIKTLAPVSVTTGINFYQ